MKLLAVCTPRAYDLDNLPIEETVLKGRFY